MRSLRSGWRAAVAASALAIGVGLACEDSTSVVILVPGSMEMAPADTLIPQRGSLQLRVIVYDTSGTPIPLLPAFTPSDTSRVTVSRTGLVRSVGPTGVASIAATLGPFARVTAVTVFDSLLSRRVPLGGRPYGAAISSTGVAYVTLLDSSRLARADLPAQTFSGTVTVGSAPSEVAFNSAGTLAYVTNQVDSTVAVVYVATDTWIDTLTITGNPFEVILAPGDSILYVTTNVDSVYGVRLATKQVVARFPVPGTANGFVVRDTLLYVSTRAGGTVVEFNLRTRTVARTFSVGGQPQKMALSASGDELYIANEAGYVQFWNLVGGGQIGTNLMLPGGGGFGMARRPNTGLLYVSTSGAGASNVHIINPTTRTLTRTIEVGGRARRVVFNASGSIGFAANEGGWIDFLR